LHWLKSTPRLGFACLLACSGSLALAQGQWLGGGNDVRNTRSSKDTIININNASTLKTKWVFNTSGDVTATPTVSAGSVYAVDFDGFLYSVNATTGVSNWTRSIASYTGNPGGSFSRTSPVVSGNNLICADQGDFNPLGAYTGFFPDSLFGDSTNKTASVFAVNKQTGNLVWRTVVDEQPWSMITSTPVVYNGVVYVGSCSFEEAAGLLGPWFVETYRGSVIALDANTGQILWRTYTVPTGYAGGAVWGSTPAVDADRGLLYVATGNNYRVPADVEQAIANDPAHGDSYLPANDYIDSVVAMNLNTGAIVWGKRLQGADTWNIARSSNAVDPGRGPDYDFGSGPNLYSVNKGSGVDRVGAGQKSGAYWSLKPDSGTVMWKTQVAPGGTTGGIQWGSATDGKMIYCGVTNSLNTPFKIKNTTYTCGTWAALSATDGSIKWQIPDPQGAKPYGMVTISNGVMFAGSTSGHMYAFDASSGRILWSFQSGGSTICGPSVVDGVVYWGSGYGRFFNAFGTGNNKLYAFDLPTTP